MTTEELTAALIKIAKSDLSKARKESEILVAQTREGTLSLTHTNGTYTLRTLGLDAKVIVSGKPATVAPVLATMYRVG
jgi:hypothetical protein